MKVLGVHVAREVLLTHTLPQSPLFGYLPRFVRGWLDSRFVFDRIADHLAAQPNIKRVMLFGVPNVAVNGNVFIAYQHGAMVFKLSGAAHAQALALPDARLWDPSDKGRPMREWVQLSLASRDQWADWADEALAYVSTLPAK
ncbi:TfoX/Sxy family protein [bacterium]|nr:TfoX/Sxy family protein [bacterium]